MIALSEFQRYLQKICCRYEQWWAVDALTETIADQQATFSFEQMVQTEEKKSGEKPQIVSLSILKGIQNYVESEHILLVGSPGVGKSTALLRCLLSFAKEELGKAEPRIPVLVPLKRYNVRFSSSEDPSGMLTLIRDALKPQLRLKIPEVEELLFQKRLILLLDGLNEMPADTVRTQLKVFREECDEIPLICTTRELGSGDLGIKRRLEVQPPTPPEIDRFLRECMPGQAQQVLQLLSRDNRELSRTPFVLWMLYHLFQEADAVVETLGEAFRQFFPSFKKYKEDAPVTDERRKAWNPWLKHLAFTMLNSPEATAPGLVISDDRAEKVLAEKFGDLHGASSRIEELLKYHLLERVSDREVSFHHQLIQEYYAAEYLLQYLPELLRDEEGETKLKCHYLNYLKWTEPIAIMLGLPEITENLAQQLIDLALKVDLYLGARLAGQVKPVCQPQTIELITSLNPPSLLKAELLGITRSEYAIATLLDLLLLKDQAPNVREKAAEALGEIGNETAVPALLKALDDDPVFTVRWATVTALGKIGSETVVPGLKKALDDTAYFVRLAAVSALGAIGGKAAISALLKALEQQKDWNVYLKAAYELEKLGHTNGITALSKALENPEFTICGKAISALELLNSERAVWALFEAIEKHPKSSVRQKAIEALGRIGSDAAIPILLKALNRNTVEVKESVIKALGQISSDAATKAMFDILTTDDNCYIRRSVIAILGQLGNKSAIPILLDILEKDEDSTVRGSAALALGKIGDEVAVSNLVEALVDTDRHVRLNAARALGQIRSEAAIPDLIQTLKNDGDFSIRLSAAEALGQIGGEAAIPELQQTLGHPNMSIRGSAARALGLIGNAKAVPDLIEALEKSDCKTLESLDCYDSLEIAIALLRLGSEVGTSALIETLKHPFPSSMFFIWNQLEVEAAIPVLMKAFEHQLIEIRSGAASALDRIQRKLKTFSETLIPVLHRSIITQDLFVCIQAIYVLNRVDSREVASILLPILRQEKKNIEVRFHAARVLAQLGREEAISVLVKALEEGDPLTQSGAAYNLAALGTEIAISGLLSPLENESFKNRAIIVEALEKIGNYKALPKLFQLQVKFPSDNIGVAIAAIQSRCQFYNYDIAQLPPPQRMERVEDLLHNKLNIITQEIKKVTEQPKRVIHTQNYFEKGTHTHTHNYANNEKLKQQIPELRQLVHQLQQTHQPTTEDQAVEIIDVEFSAIQETNPTRWQKIKKQLQLLKCQLLNPERHLTASKAALGEVAKHYLEDSVIAKALITYVDAMSADTDQGE
ncbi:MAG TPA: HEAT repeat domain-containing protein [Coleofasciculaceae cyanobacterium]|jgi:HEAT repeat protein